MIERVRKAFNEGALLNEFIPVPEDLKIVAGRLSDETEQAALERQEQDNLKKYGYKTWYDFCVNEWGTKWDIGADGYLADDHDGNNNEAGLMLHFDSAWSPPIAAYEKLQEMGFEVRAYYYESGMCFAGVWEDGVDDFYDMSDCSDAQMVEDLLPTVLDEMFCISEGMREYEEENAEDEELYTWTKEGAEKKAASE